MHLWGKAIFTSTTMKAHIAGGEIARKYGIGPCTNPDDNLQEDILQHYSEKERSEAKKGTFADIQNL